MEKIIHIKIKKTIFSCLFWPCSSCFLFCADDWKSTFSGSSAFGQNVIQIHNSGEFSILKLCHYTLAIQIYIQIRIIARTFRVQHLHLFNEHIVAVGLLLEEKAFIKFTEQMPLVNYCIYTLKTECYACSLIFTQFGNGAALAIELHLVVSSYHTLSLCEKYANLCLNLL